MKWQIFIPRFFSITNLTIDYLKQSQKNSSAFKSVLTEKWNVKIVEAYVNCVFFEDQTDQEVQIDVREFIKKHFERLTDDAFIRGEINEFYCQFQDMREDEKTRMIKTIDFENIWIIDTF